MQLQVGGDTTILGSKGTWGGCATFYPKTWSRSLSEYEAFNKGLIILTKEI